ncbi:MAG: YqaA family protein [Planctomycetota bacterium]
MKDREESTLSGSPEGSEGEGAGRVSRNPLRRLYLWVLSWAETRYGTPALFFFALAEATFFPIPPDVLLIALVLGARRKAFRYAAVCTVGSIAGALLGYGIGWAAAPLAKTLVGELAGVRFYYEVAEAYGENAFLAIAVAGFTPIPYKVFTLTAGIFHESVSLWTLVGASLCSRTARFFLVAGLIYFFGPTMKRWIDRYFNLLALLFGVLLVLGFLLLGGLHTGPLEKDVQIRVLLQELSHPDPELRAEAVKALRSMAKERGEAVSFGFDPAKSPEENGEAIRRWKAWGEKAREE